MAPSDTDAGSTARPDPTSRTLSQVENAVAALEKLVDTRIDAIDKGIALLQSNADKSPSIAVVAQTVEGNKQLYLEKFESVNVRFKEQDNRIDEALRASERFAKQQDDNFATANDKSEKGVTKEIDAVKTNVAQNTKSIEDKIAALDKRITEINGHSQGMGDGWKLLLGVVGLVLTIVTIIGTVIAIMK